MKKLMKSRLTPLLTLLLSIVLVFSSLALFTNVNHTASAAVGTAGWTAIGSASVGSTDGDGYTSVTCSGWGGRAYYNEAVALNGLKVYHKMTAYAGNGFTGFGLAGDSGIYPPESKTFMTYYRRSTDWDFLYYSTSHDAAATGSYCAFSDQSMTTTDYGIDTNRFYGFTKSSTLSISILFTQISGNVYAMDISFLAGTALSGRNKYTRTYFDATKAGITNGNVYVFAIGESGNGATLMKVETGASSGGTSGGGTGENPGGNTGGDAPGGTVIVPGGSSSIIPNPIGWTPSNNVGAIYNEFNRSTKLYNFKAFGDMAQTSSKVKLDGLTLNYYFDDLDTNRISGVYKSSGSWFSFSFNKNSGQSAETISSAGNFTMNIRPFFGMQPSSENSHVFLTFRGNNDPASANIASTTETGSPNDKLTERHGGNQYAYDIVNPSDGVGATNGLGGKVAFSIHFEKVGNVYKITTTCTMGSYYIDQDAVGKGVTPPTEGEVCYVSANYFNNALDANGETYLYGFGDRSVNVDSTSIFVGVIPASMAEFVPTPEVNPDNPGEVVDPKDDPYYNYDDQGNYIGSCFGGVEVSSMIIASVALVGAVVMIIIKRKKALK